MKLMKPTKFCERCANYEKHDSLERCGRCYRHYISSEHKIAIYFRPKTNADRIRAMSDEELADYWLKCTCVCDWCSLKAKCDEDTISKDRCMRGILEWLKQPAEGE